MFKAICMLWKDLKRSWALRNVKLWGYVQLEVKAKEKLNNMLSINMYMNTHSEALGKDYEIYSFQAFKEISVQSLTY